MTRQKIPCTVDDDRVERVKRFRLQELDQGLLPVPVLGHGQDQVVWHEGTPDDSGFRIDPEPDRAIRQRRVRSRRGQAEDDVDAQLLADNFGETEIC